MIVSSMRARGTNTRNGKAIEPAVAADSVEAAEEAGLQYVNDERLVTTAKRKAKTSSIWTWKENRFATSSGCFG